MGKPHKPHEGLDIDSRGHPWLDNPLEGDGNGIVEVDFHGLPIKHDNCGTDECCQTCDDDDKEGVQPDKNSV